MDINLLRIGVAMQAARNEESFADAQEVLRKEAALGHSDIDNQSTAVLVTRIYEAGDNTNTVGYKVMKKFASSDKWYKEFNPVVRSARVGMGKSASSLLGMLTLPGSIAGSSKVADLGKILLGGSLATGVALGGAGHLTHKRILQGDADNKALESKIEVYNQISREIEEELQNSGVLNTESKEDDQKVLDSFEM